QSKIVQRSPEMFLIQILPVTVVIPVKNRRDHILLTLRSLMKQIYLPQEVLVIDDQSTDGTWEILTNFKETVSSPFRLILHRMEKRKRTGGPAPPRNYGIIHASADLVAFTDSDCIADKNWLFHLTRPLLHLSCPPKLVGTGGVVKSFYSNFIGMYFEVAGTLNPPPELPYLVTANCCYKKEVLNEVGRFNEKIFTGEDSELGVRLVHRGYCFRYVPNAIIYHFFPSKIRDFINSYFKYGKGAYFTYKTEKTITRKIKTNDKKKNPSLCMSASGDQKILLKRINLLSLSNLVRKITKTTLQSFKMKPFLLGIILFHFLDFLAAFSLWKGFTYQQRLEYIKHAR
ncbi:MAG: glycosyltransferase, partial [Candidatus Hodarchaeota archaeon]